MTNSAPGRASPGPTGRTVLAGLIAALCAGAAWAQTSPPPEYKWWALKIKAYDAHQLIGYPGGITAPTNTKGQGITLAIVDTGVSRHTEFGPRLLGGYDFWNSTGDGTNDQYGHGTHVAGIAGAGVNGTGIAGIAPEASLISLRVLDASGAGSSATIDAGVRWALTNYVKASAGVPAQKTVFNLSLGGTSPFGLSTLQAIRHAGTIAVVAAGNAGGANPSYPARYASDASVAGWVLAVGAVDANNRLATFSNKAGDARNYYLVAPGVSIESTYPTNTTATMSGTSMATPMVSGAAAAVWGAWPYLSGDRVVNSLLWSATDLGTKGVDSTYGWGLLNLSAAMQPIGETCVPTSTNSCSSKPGGGKKSALFSTPTAAGMAAIKTNARLIGYDALGRHFEFSAAMLLKAGSVNLTQNMSAWLAATEPVKVVASGGKRLAYQGQDSAGASAFAFSQPAGVGEVMMFSGAPVLPFGVSHSAYRAHAFASDDALKIPYLSFIQSPTGMAYDYNPTQTLGMRLGYVTAGPQYYQPADQNEPGMQRMNAGTALGELSARLGKLELTGTLGSLNEAGAFLGARSDAAQRSMTVFTSLSAVYEMDHGLSVLTSMTEGHSTGTAGSGDAQYRTTTQAFSAGLLKQAVFGTQDRLSLAAVLPSRVRSGGMTLRAATDVNMETGEPIFGAVPVSLVPQGRERRFEMTWSVPTTYGNVSLNAMHRIEPNHDALAPPESIIGVRLAQRF